MSDAPVRRGLSKHIGATLKALIRTRITTGLATVLPIAVTVWLVRFVFGIMRDASLWLVEAFLLSSRGAAILEAWGIQPSDVHKGLGAYPTHVQWGISLISVSLTLFSLYMIGLITANVVGRRALQTGEELLGRVPMIKTIYRSCKQIVSSFGSEQAKGFQSVALIPFPDEKMRSIGFVTSIFYDARTQEELVTVFIPTTPNPTTGFLEILKREDIVELDWTVEQAITTIMSVGTIRPDLFSLAHAAKKAAPGLTDPESQ